MDSGGRIRVLAVDDDQAFLDLLAEYLEAEHGGMTVEAAPSVEKALSAIESDGGFDCVVSDYAMPGATGLDLLAAVREDHPEIPFVLLADEGNEEVASEAISKGVDDYVQKQSVRQQYDLAANRIENVVSRSQAEQSYREIFEKATVGLTVRDPETGRIVDANPEYCEMMGYDREEIVELTMEEISAGEEPYTAERARELVRRAAEDGPQTFEWLDRTRNGEKLWVEVTLQLTDIGGTERVLASVVDITERKERQQELEEREQRFRSIAEASYDIIFQLDEAGHYTYVSPAVERIAGYDPGSLVGAHFRKLTTEATLPKAREEFERVLGGEPGEGIELEIRRKDGRTARVAINARPLYEGDKVTGVQGVARDITERRRRERELRESKEQIEALYEAATAVSTAESFEAVGEHIVEAARGILRFDLCSVSLVEDGLLVTTEVSEPIDDEGYYEGVPLDATDSLAAETYRTREAAIVDTLHETPYVPAESEYRAAISVPMGDHGVFQAVAREASAFDERDLELSELLASHATAAMDRIARERDLEAQNERLEQFASVVSHDLRNPLEIARGYFDAARETGDTEQLAEADRALGRMERLIDDVLQLARGGESVTDPEIVSLAAVAEAAWANVETGDATVEVESLTIEADGARLQRLLENLLRNAVEHGGSDVTVEIGPVDETGFYVADDGPGIPPERRDRVFELGVTDDGDGTGLGLAIVREIAAVHGWSVSATESDAGGARFEVTGVEVI